MPWTESRKFLATGMDHYLPKPIDFGGVDERRAVLPPTEQAAATSARHDDAGSMIHAPQARVGLMAESERFQVV